MGRKAYVIQENGQVTLPLAFRKKYGLKKGDAVVFKEIEGGLVIDARETLALKLLDEIGDVLEQKGISLDELIESGRETRQALYDEKYGDDAE
jgi:AbrB family looped-hinge helix DNA binding protein